MVAHARGTPARGTACPRMWRRSHPAPRRGHRDPVGVGFPVALPSDCLPAETGHQGCPGSVPDALLIGPPERRTDHVDSSAITDDDPAQSRPHVVRSLEGRILAGSRPTSINPGTTESGSTRTTPQSPQPGTHTAETDMQKIPGAPLRVSFAKIQEPLEVPDLLALQTASFDWLIGSPEWRATLAPEEQADAVGGLAEILEEISPIEDFSGSMSLSFSNPRFEDVKASIEECKDKDMTYAAPLFVTAEFTNNTTGEIKSQTVFMGDFPMMTRKGTFIINGTERVVVSQLVRSPGVYFDRTLDKTSDVDVYGVKVIPSRGAWLEFDVDKRSTVGVRIDRKRRQPVTVLLKALGWTAERIREHLSWSETLLATLEKDHIANSDEALLDIYRKLRPGEPPTRESAQALLENLFFNPKRYDLAKVGRYKVNKKLGIDVAIADGTLTELDIVKTIEYLIRLHAGEEGYETDDIDHFGNRRLRTVGELIQNQIRVGLSRMERVVRERMTTQDVEAITPQTLINIRPVVASIKEFFGTSQLSQFMDQNNPLAGL